MLELWSALKIILGILHSMILKDKRVFIIEDNDTNLQIMEIVLQSAGAKTEVDRWGIKTTSRLKAAMPIDVILLDLMLPKKVIGEDPITGYQVYQEIRDEVEFDDIPIAAVSAVARESVIPVLRDKGFAGFIGKPLDITEFPNQVASIIDGQTFWDE